MFGSSALQSFSFLKLNIECPYWNIVFVLFFNLSNKPTCPLSGSVKWNSLWHTHVNRYRATLLFDGVKGKRLSESHHLIVIPPSGSMSHLHAESAGPQGFLPGTRFVLTPKLHTFTVSNLYGDLFTTFSAKHKQLGETLGPEEVLVAEPSGGLWRKWAVQKNTPAFRICSWMLTP